ncbi:MAG: hypothetical protein HFI38_13625 [Lachnospiraceae bacterium]|jgi:sugar (pentulose or hexulose) kinase|nr:hypothetical protein [Lachnospiraceae bacterium]
MLLILDIGTSSMRGLLIDLQGNIRKKIQRSYTLTCLPDGGVEMEMEKLDRALWECLQRMGDFCTEEGVTLEGISVTSQRSSVIPMGPDGRAQGNALMWQDRRCARLLEKQQPGSREIYEICGMRLSPVMSAPKMGYMKEHMPDLYDRAVKLIGFQEYVLHWLTGVYATDTSIASRTGLYDLKKDRWSRELLDRFGVAEKKLCPLVPVGSVVGETAGSVNGLLRTGRNVPVVSAGGDQQCAVLGMKCGDGNDMICNMGTGAYVIALTDHPVIDNRMRVNCNVSAVRGKWILEGMVLNAGTTLDWLCALFYGHLTKEEALKELIAEAKASETGARGLHFKNALTGTGTPAWDTQVRAEFTGIELRHQREDFVRAGLEGVIRDVAACAKSVEDLLDTPCTAVRVAGGLSKSEWIVDLLSEQLQKPVCVAAQREATGLGAFLSGMKALHMQTESIADGL